MSDPGFGAQLRLWRERRGLKQEEVADLVGVGQQTVSWWERAGISRYDAKRFQTLERVFKLKRGTIEAAWLASRKSGNAGTLQTRLREMQSELEELRHQLDDGDEASA